MAKQRETKIEAWVVGHTSEYRYSRVNDVLGVLVTVTGMGPDGKLSGNAIITPPREISYFGEVEGVKLTGENRYSFMHGSHSLSHNEPVAAEIRSIAKAKAAEWLIQNPKSKTEYSVKLAEAAVKKAQNDLRGAHALVELRADELGKKSIELAAAQEAHNA